MSERRIVEITFFAEVDSDSADDIRDQIDDALIDAAVAVCGCADGGECREDWSWTAGSTTCDAEDWEKEQEEKDTLEQLIEELKKREEKAETQRAPRRRKTPR